MADPIPELVRPRGNPAMRRGAPSLNPGGRPRDQLGALIRERVDPEVILAALLEVVENKYAKTADRLRAIELIADRAWGRPQSNMDVNVTARSSSLPTGWAAMSTGDREQWLAAIDEERRLLGSAS